MTADVRQIDLIHKRGELARKAHEDVKRAFAKGLRERDPEAYTELLRKFRTATRLACNDLDHADIAGSGMDIDRAIGFLTADPYFFRSGYLKSVLLRRLKQATLTDDQKRNLAELVLLRVIEPRRCNRHDYGRLAAALAWLPLDEALAACANNGPSEVCRRAKEMIRQISSQRSLLGAAT